MVPQYTTPLFALRQKTPAGRTAPTWARRSLGCPLSGPPLRGFDFLPSPACAPSPFRGTAPVLAGDRIRPGEGTWAPGEEAGGQPLVRTGRSLCVRTQCDCAASSPAIRRRCWPPRRRRSRARTCSRRSRRWEAAEGDVGVGGRRLHTRARSGRYTGSPVAEVGRVGRGGGLACTRPRPSVRCWRYRDGAKRQIVGGAATGAPTQRVHSRLPAGGKPMVHELKWSAEGTDPPGARQKPPDAGVDDGLRFEHPGPAGEV